MGHRVFSRSKYGCWGALTILSFWSATLPAQINLWTKPTSGLWEEPYWSLGVPPDITQGEVVFTNSGRKDLAIGTETVRHFPSSLRIVRLTISAPADAFNTLLLNHSGVDTPLVVEDSFRLGSNAAFIAFSSALHVGQTFQVNGQATQTDFSEVIAPTLHVGESSPGGYHMSNGVLTVSNRLIVGDNAPGAFHQDGGWTLSSRIELRRGGEYFLRGGEVAVGELHVRSLDLARFDQSGGKVSATNRVILGELRPDILPGGLAHYVLRDGILSTPMINVGTEPAPRIGFDGKVEQLGGSNLAGGIQVGAGEGRGTYLMSGGLLATSSSAVGPGRNAAFHQSNGVHAVQDSLVVHGYYERGFAAIYASYNLSGGSLRSGRLTVGLARFLQSGGTNEVLGDLVLEDEQFAATSYILGAGQLLTSNTTVFGSFQGGFHQTGGFHRVAGLLHLVAPASYSPGPNPPLLYDLSGGELAVHDIRLGAGTRFRHHGGTIYHSGSLTLAGGHWESAPGEHPFGPLQLSAASTNSSVSLPDSPAVMRLAASAGQAWESSARLIITNWRGAISGGGFHQIMVGENSAGLAIQQLGQILFRNPPVLPIGDYSAAILASGELVPGSPTAPVLVFRQEGNSVILEWPVGYTLQTATNVLGPFSDLGSGSGSHTHSIVDDESQRFFRLRQ